MDDDPVVGMTVGLAVDRDGFVMFGTGIQNGDPVEMPVMQGAKVRQSQKAQVDAYLAWLFRQNDSA